MAAHACLKNEITEDEKCNNLMRCLITIMILLCWTKVWAKCLPLCLHLLDTSLCLKTALNLRIITAIIGVSKYFGFSQNIIKPQDSAVEWGEGGGGDGDGGYKFG